MKTQALFELRDHSETNLWPFPDRMQHIDTSEFDFNSEVGIFETNLTIVFRELKDNIIECSKEEAQKYASRVIEILQETREQVNQFFRSDTRENNEYNKKLQQIEIEGVIEEPVLGLTPADSISEDKLEFPTEAVALYLNKICLWWFPLFQRYTTNETESQARPAPVKLSFVCQNNQVYYLFRWLKTHGWISNTNDEIINFLINHTSFKGDTPTYTTIRAELTRVADLPETKKFIPPQD